MAVASRSIFLALRPENSSLANIVSLMCFVKNMPVLRHVPGIAANNCSIRGGRFAKW